MGHYIFIDHADLVPNPHSFVVNGFPGDVVMQGNADGVTDRSRLISTGKWSAVADKVSAYSASGCALNLTNTASARLTVGGDWSALANDYYLALASTSTNSIVVDTLPDGVDPDNYRAVGDYNIFTRLVDSPSETKAIYAQGKLDLVLTAQAGADVKRDNQDVNIRIGAESVVKRNHETYSGTAASLAPTTNQSSAIAIDVTKNLSVLSDLIGTIEAKADLTAYGVRVEATSGTVTPANTSVNQAADSIGVRTGGDLVLERNFTATIDAQSKMDLHAYASLAATGNTADAVGLKAAGNLTAVAGEWNGEIKATTSGGAADATIGVLVSGSTATNSSNLSSNSFSAYGIWADGNIAISHLANGSITVESSDNALTANVANGPITASNNTVGAIGIKGSTVKLDRVDETFVIAAETSGNSLSAVETSGGTSSAFTFGNNTFQAVGIAAETLQLGSFRGNISVDLSDNSFYKKWSKTPTGSVSYFKAHGITVSGAMTAGDTLGGSIGILAENLDGGSTGSLTNTFSMCGIDVGGKLTVDGRIDTDILLLAGSVSSATSYLTFGVNAESLTADALSGNLVANDGTVGLNVQRTLASTKTGDAFDFNGNIYGFQTGIAAFSTLNLRVSGTITNTGGDAIIAEHYRQDWRVASPIWIYNSGSNNDRVEIAAGAVVEGDIQLSDGINTLTVNSNAAVFGRLLAEEGRLNLRFNLDGAALQQDLDDDGQTDAIVTTGDGDISLTSNITISVNLNRAADDTYTLFQYDGDVSEYWIADKIRREITFSYQGETRTVRASGGMAHAEFSNGITADLNVSVEDSGNSFVTVTVAGTGNVELPDFEFAADTLAASQPDKDNKPTEVRLTWGGSEEPQYDSYEVEYWIDKNDGNGYGNSIVVMVSAKDARITLKDNSKKFGTTINGIAAGETVKWRVRGNTRDGDVVSKWSDEGATPYTETFSYEAEEIEDPAMRSTSTPRAVSPDNADLGNNASTVRFQWNAAEGDVEIARYTVRYIQSEEKLDPESLVWGETTVAAKTLKTDEKPKVVDVEPLPICYKTTTAHEIFASNLPNQSYIYWQVQATDAAGNDSEWQNGENFRVWAGDETKPVWVKGVSPKPKDFTGYEIVDDKLSEDKQLAYDISFEWGGSASDEGGSGVKSLVFSYKLQSESWDDTTKVTEITVNDPKANSVTVQGMVAGDYNFRVQAVDWVGNRSAYLSGSMTLGDDNIAPVWAENTKSATTLHFDKGSVKGSATITWDPASDTVGLAGYSDTYVGSIKEYRIALDNGTPVAIGNVTTYTYESNVLGTDYKDHTYTITAYDFAGNVSEELTGTFYYGDLDSPDWGAEAVVRKSVVYRYGENAANVTIDADFSWDAADDHDGTGVKEYVFEYRTVGAAEWTSVITAERNYSVTGLTPGDYEYRISAVDFLDNRTNAEDALTGALPTITPNTAEMVVGSLPVTAKFSPGSVIREYSRDGENWQAFLGDSVTLTINGELSFRGKDAAENIIDEMSAFLVKNIIPGVPTVTASITELTRDPVILTADFGEYAVQKQYSTDGENWQAYTVDGVPLTENGTVYFRYTNTRGEESAVGSYEVTNIDRIPPEAPTVSVSTVTTANQVKATITATFSQDSEQKQYSTDGENWQAYTSPLTMTASGVLYFRGIDKAGNISETTIHNVNYLDYSVSGVGSSAQTVDLNVSGKYFLVGSFSGITGSVTVLNGGKAVGKGTIKNGVLTFNKGQSVLLDSSRPTQIQVSVKSGSNAYSAKLVAEKLYDRGDTDSSAHPRDLGVVNTPGATLLSDGWVGFGDERDYLRISLNTAAQLVLNCTATDATKFTLYNSKTGKKMTSSTLKRSGSLATKATLLTAGTYYVEVQSTNAKKGGYSDYKIAVGANTIFYTNADNSDDTFATAKSLGAVTSTQLLDSGWVGYSDTVDYKSFTLNSAAKAQFTLNATDATSLTVYQVSGSKRKVVGKTSTKSGAATTNDLLLGAGTYYLEVKSTNASKGGNSTYSVNLGSATFYTRGDSKDDTYYGAAANAAYQLGVISSSTTSLVTDEWVGLGDVTDFRVFTLEAPASLQFNVRTDGSTKFSVSQERNGKLKTLQTTSFSSGSGNSNALFLKAGTYYLSMQSTNAAKGGSAEYSISLNSNSVFYPADYTGDGTDGDTGTSGGSSSGSGRIIGLGSTSRSSLDLGSAPLASADYETEASAPALAMAGYESFTDPQKDPVSLAVAMLA